MDFYEETTDSKRVFEGKVLNLRVDKVRLPGGGESTREIVEHPGGVTIIPVTESGKIILVEQFRKPVDRTLLELPAGKLEQDEEPETSASRELIEETGFQAGEMTYLFSFNTSPGFTDEVLHLFLATGLKEVGTDPDEDEIIKLHQIETDEVVESIKTGKITDGKTIMGLMYYLKGDLG